MLYRYLINRYLLALLEIIIINPLNAASQIYGIPTRKDSVIGRDQELKHVQRKLDKSHSAVIVGLPGIGKTTLAYAYCTQHSAQYDYIIYIDCSLSLSDGLLNFAQQWNNDQRNHQRVIPEIFLQRLAASQLLNHWVKRQPGKWLVVLDQLSIEEEGSAFPYVSETFHVLVTTRKRSGRNVIILKQFEREDSIKFLVYYLGYKDNLNELAKVLSDYPLALKLAALTIKNIPTLDIKSYIDSYKSFRGKLHHLHDNVNKYVETDYQRNVKAAMKEVMDGLADKPEVLRVLKALSYLKPSSISYDLIDKFLLHAKMQTFDLHQIILHLKQINLIEFEGDEKSFRFDGFVQESIKDNLTALEAQELLMIWYEVFNGEFYLDYNGLSEQSFKSPELYYHAKNICEASDKLSIHTDSLLALKINIANIAQFFMNKFKEAENISTEIKNLVEASKSLSRLFKAKFFNTYGNVLVYMDLQQAIACSQKAVALLKKPLTKIEASEKFFALINNLPDFYKEQGMIHDIESCINEAEPLLLSLPEPFFQSLFYVVKARAKMNIGNYQDSLTYLTKAESFVNNVLLSSIASNLKAETLARLDQFDQSYEIAKVCLEEIKFLSPEGTNHKILMLQFLVAYNLVHLGAQERAKEIAYEAWESMKVFLEVESHDVTLEGFAYLTLGDIHMALGRKEEAREFYLNAVKVYRNHYSFPEPDDLSAVYERLVVLSINCNDYPLSKKYFNQQVESYGLNHPRTLKLVKIFDDRDINVPWG